MESGYHDGDHSPKRPRRHDGSCAGDHADLLCALPDEILIAILARVRDSRAAVSTSTLSRRWRRLDPARWIPAFGFSVGDHLPPEHAATLRRYRSARSGGGGDDDDDARWALARQVAACEDRAMEAYVRGLARFLRSPERYPAARSLRLEFFLAAPTPEDHDGAAAGRAMAECLASAFSWADLERLAVYAFPRCAAAGGAAAATTRQPAHVFPDPEPVRALLTASRVATLHVKNCLAQSGRGYGLLFPALTRLTVEVTPRVKAVFPRSYFNDLVQSCRELVFLRLVSCCAAGAAAAQPFPFVVDLPPSSKLRELDLETCNFVDLRLVSAPSLERLVVKRCKMLSSLTVGIAPRLATMVWHGVPPWIYGGGTASLRFVELRAEDDYIWISEKKLASFFLKLPKVEVLELCFRGPPPLVDPTMFPSRFENLKKVLIDLPRAWPLHLIKKLLEKLLEVATSLEKLHINFFAPALRTSDEWDKTPRNDSADGFQHTFQLRQIVMEGFDRTEEQIALIRILLRSCRSLKTLLLIWHHAILRVKLGRQGGIACPSWSMQDEKAEIVAQLRDGIHSDAKIVLR